MMSDDELDALLAGMSADELRRLDQEARRFSWLCGAAPAEMAGYDVDAALCSGHRHPDDEA